MEANMAENLLPRGTGGGGGVSAIFASIFYFAIFWGDRQIYGGKYGGKYGGPALEIMGLIVASLPVVKYHT